MVIKNNEVIVNTKPVDAESELLLALEEFGIKLVPTSLRYVFKPNYGYYCDKQWLGGNHDWNHIFSQDNDRTRVIFILNGIVIEHSLNIDRIDLDSSKNKVDQIRNRYQQALELLSPIARSRGKPLAGLAYHGREIVLYIEDSSNFERRCFPEFEILERKKELLSEIKSNAFFLEMGDVKTIITSLYDKLEGNKQKKPRNDEDKNRIRKSIVSIENEIKELRARIGTFLGFNFKDDFDLRKLTAVELNLLQKHEDVERARSFLIRFFNTMQVSLLSSNAAEHFAHKNSKTEDLNLLDSFLEDAYNDPVIKEWAVNPSAHSFELVIRRFPSFMIAHHFAKYDISAPTDFVAKISDLLRLIEEDSNS